MGQKPILLISHGPLAEGMKTAVEMVAGNQDNLFTLTLSPHQSPEDFYAKLEEMMKGFSDQEAIILADMKGGTPCNMATLYAMKHTGVTVYAGVNMPLLLSLCMETEECDNPDELVQTARLGLLKIR